MRELKELKKMIKKIYLKPYLYKIYCDECGEEMIQSSSTLMSNPPQYIYKCFKCKKQVRSEINANEVYYEEI